MADAQLPWPPATRAVVTTRGAPGPAARAAPVTDHADQAASTPRRRPPRALLGHRFAAWLIDTGLLVVEESQGVLKAAQEMERVGEAERDDRSALLIAGAGTSGNAKLKARGGRCLTAREMVQVWAPELGWVAPAWNTQQAEA